MGEKVTVMVLKVDLQCPSCYKKIKKILCNIPQIRGQIYDDKQNTVTINVVCCSPEKIRDKLCCKGGKVIQSVEIKGPKKCKEQKPEEEKPKEEKPKEEKPKEEKPDNPPPPPTQPMKERILVPLHPLPLARTCCGPCSEGYGGGPCYHGYPYPPSCNYSCYGYWCRCGCGRVGGCGRGDYWCGGGCGGGGGGGGGCGCGRGCHMGMCVCYIEETHPAECKIM